MNKNYEVSIDIRLLCLCYFLIFNLIILIMQESASTLLIITWGISAVVWTIIFTITLSKILIIFLKNRKGKNV